MMHNPHFPSLLCAECDFGDSVLWMKTLRTAWDVCHADGVLIINYDELLVANNASTNGGEKNLLSGSETVSVVFLQFLTSVDSHRNDDFINIQFKFVLKRLEVFKRFI